MSYHFIFKKSEKLIKIWDLGMSNQYCYEGRAGILKQSLCGVRWYIFRIALSRRCHHALVNCCATTSDYYMFCPEKISPLTKYLSDTGLS